MNIFIIDHNIENCARDLCDQHCVKMVTEYVQLLSTTLVLNDHPAPYKLTHKNHPCSLWVRESKNNYSWLWRLTDLLGLEYTKRFNKVHKSHENLIKHVPCILNKLPNIDQTPFVNCTPYKNIEDTICAYRKFYIDDKSNFARWKYSSPPKWFTNKEII